MVKSMDGVLLPIVEKLKNAALQGVMLAGVAALAGCSAKEESASTTRNTDPTDAADTGSNSPLSPYALDALTCHGPVYDGGYSGQCCVAAHCYTPEAGAACVAAELVRWHGQQMPRFPTGSGRCGCTLSEDTEASVAGPFAPNPADTPESAGECCYLAGSIGCVGRPLMMDGKLLVAELVERGDWISHS